jgi:hypothetical protein
MFRSLICSSSGGAIYTAIGIFCAQYVGWLLASVYFSANRLDAKGLVTKEHWNYFNCPAIVYLLPVFKKPHIAIRTLYVQRALNRQPAVVIFDGECMRLIATFRTRHHRLTA